MSRTEVKINSKFTVTHDNGANLQALRYGSPWRSCEGDGLVLAMAQEIERLRKEYRALALKAPEGFVLVPVEPTPDMMQAACECGAYPGMNDWWRAMLAARPQGLKE